MKKNYLYITFVFLCLSSSFMAYSQTVSPLSSNTNQIEGLTIHPNPVSNGKVYIITASKLKKHIEIFDVLGKKVHAATLFGKELNVSKLTPGIYILKIKEQGKTATRKLVIR